MSKNATLILKLVSGEEIVATVVSLKDQVYTLKNVVRFVINNEGLGMAPWMPFAKDGDISLNQDKVVTTAELDDEIGNAYRAKFGMAPGLVLPPKKGLKLALDD